jgi:hypothetical protein
VASDGTIYIGSLDGKVYAIDGEGSLRRTYATADELRASPILHNGRLYVPSYDYRLYAFDTGHVPASSAWPMHRQNARRAAREQPNALAIGVQPQPRTAEVAETVTFAVGAVGRPPLSYQWSFQGQPVAGATAATLRVDPVTHASAGQYSVRVTDASGSLNSSAAALTVSTPLLPPTVFTAPASQSTIAGNKVALLVGATGTMPMTYQWIRDGAPIAGATDAAYTIDVSRAAHNGSYAVRISNLAGVITSAAAMITVTPVSRISNLSIRSQVAAGTGALTMGLTVGGADTRGTKPLLIRAIGPTLGAFGVGDALTDPRLAVLSGSAVIAENDDWGGGAQLSATFAAVGAFGFSSPASKDAALAFTPGSGGYTVRIAGDGSTGGVALAEVYDTSLADDFLVTTPRLTNVSALTQAGTDGDVLIAGFAISGTKPLTVLVRGIGPTLAAFGVGDALADPKLELFRGGTSSAMSTNDNWGASLNPAEIVAAAARVGAFALALDSKDAVLLLTLPPGSYTAQVSGVAQTTGTALVEVYEVP